MVDSTQKFSNPPPLPPHSSGSDGSLQSGSVLQNRYRIISVLGVGGMGSVYLARDLHFPNVVRNVAVKEMLNMQADTALRELTLRNFERESDVLASLTHPAVPKIFEYFPTKDKAYLVMEYIDGKDLEAELARTTEFIPTDMVRRWAIELCDVLSYLHTHQPEPIIFRDVKPSNIMIDKSGRIRLIDFGIAKPFQASGPKGTLIGTEGYSPPEQYKGEASPVSDIYAVGATLHHLLTRRDPRMEAPFTFMERPIRVTNPKVSAEFEAIIMKALSPESGARYQSAAEMKAALETIDRPVATTPGAAAAAEQAFIDESKMKALWTAKVEDEIRSSPIVFKGIVYIAAYDNNLYAFNAADGKPIIKFATEDGIPGTPSIAAEENLILIGSEDHKMYGLELRTLKKRWEFDSGGAIRSSSIVEHGHVFFGNDSGTLHGVRLHDGKSDWNYSVGTAIRSRPAVTEDRFLFGTESGDLLCVDLNRSLKWRFKAKRAVTSSPVIFDGIAYVGAMDGQIHAVAVDGGYGIWHFRTGKAIVSSPIVVEKMVYVGSADGYLYALDLNGKEQWKFKTDGQIVSTPAYFNGALYFGSTDKKVYSIDAKRGRLRWAFETDGPITSSAAIVDNIVYIGSTDKVLYALNA